MDFYIGLLQVIGVHTLLGLSAWCILHTGQVSMPPGGSSDVFDHLLGRGLGLIRFQFHLHSLG